MTKPLLTITVKCKGNVSCLFDGKDLFLDIRITNNEEKEEIGFPLAFVQKTGPIIRLIDTRTKKETYLRTNPADFDLQDKFTPIPPGESVVLEWVITSHELEEFDKHFVDLTAEITLMAKIQVGGKHADFRGNAQLLIVGKNKP